jgi:predicted nucleic acid-binding protein
VSAICIVDTSVFCSILRIPNRDQHHDRAMAELTAHVGARDTLLLPLAAIYETGNHLAQNGSGQQRRSAAERFVQQVRAAFTGEAPWTPTPMPLPEDFAAWLDGFPDHAMRGIGLGDLSIIRVWERQCELHHARRVLVWSYDAHLSGYDRPPLL